MDWLPLIIFVAIQVAGVLVLIHWWSGKDRPFPAYRDPRQVFWLVRREDRAAYSRIMRRTVAVQFRDMSRSMARFQREIGKRLLPVMQRFFDTLSVR